MFFIFPSFSSLKKGCGEKSFLSRKFSPRILFIINKYKQLSSLNDVVYLFNDTALGENTAKSVKGIDRGILTDNRTGIKNASASDIGVVAENAAYFAKTRLVLNVAVNYDILTVGLEV